MLKISPALRFLQRAEAIDPFDRNINCILRRDHEKISYERRANESVDEKSLSLAMSRKTTKKKLIHEGLKKMKISKLH